MSGRPPRPSDANTTNSPDPDRPTTSTTATDANGHSNSSTNNDAPELPAGNAPELPTGNAPEPALLSTNPEPGLAADFGLYQLMDAVFGRQPSSQDPPGTNDNTAETSLPGAAAAESDRASAIPGDLPQATLSSEAPDNADNSGSIVITVNYMFMEGGDQGNPGRTGSLVVTLPNNATNREPRIILQFISLATRMAYSALVTNAPKVQPGVTLEKFNSFAIKAASELADSTCAICFEQYESPPAVPLETVASKKRKLGPDSHCVSASSSTDRLADTLLQIPTSAPAANDTSNTDRNTDSNTDSNADSNTDTNAGSNTETPETRPKYLCEFDTEYGHLPLQLPCGHTFGQSCLSHWLKENTSCPLCRVSLGEPRERPQVAPISYIRFGGLGNSEDEPASSDRDTPLTASSIIDRATLVLFNPLLTPAAREAPPLPLIPDRERERARARNSLVSPVIDNILSYFGRARRQRESAGADAMFTSGVASRRTPNGVETVNSDHLSPGESFHNFASLTGHHGSESNDENTSPRGDDNDTHNDGGDESQEN